jgi:hypothetical protein
MKKLVLMPLLLISVWLVAQAPVDTTVKNPVCPVCKTHQHVIPIVYGKPGKELIEKDARGEIRLSGCMPGKARYYCRKDNREF